jgi:C-terminal processing protease CtpA/Prc
VPLASTPSDATAQPSAGSNGAVVDEVWQTVRDHFYDPNLGGLDWTAARARYEPQSVGLMNKGDLLLLAVDDVRVHGERLEGTGVDPTIAVPFASRYSAGWDQQLERAIAVLSHG